LSVDPWLASRVERAARHVVWQTPLIKEAALNGVYEAIGDYSRPAELQCFGLAVSRARNGITIVEAYAHGPAPVRNQFRRGLANLMGLPVGMVSIRPSWGFSSFLAAGEPAAHHALAVSGSFGTLGGFAADLEGPLLLCVSNNHVFANCNQCNIGDELLDGAGSVFGHLHRFHPLVGQPGVNDLDGAVGWILDGQVDGDWNHQGARSPHVGLRVWKVGAASGYTAGVVTSVLAAPFVNYGPPLGAANFRRCVIIMGDGNAPFSIPGDSGSLVYDVGGAVVGIIFAGDTVAGYSLANSVDFLTSRLRITL